MEKVGVIGVGLKYGKLGDLRSIRICARVELSWRQLGRIAQCLRGSICIGRYICICIYIIYSEWIFEIDTHEREEHAIADSPDVPMSKSQRKP